jgi:transposase-like protein
MTRKQYTPLTLEVKHLLSEDQDCLQPMVRGLMQEILEAEMDECLQAGKHERTA